MQATERLKTVSELSTIPLGDEDKLLSPFVLNRIIGQYHIPIESVGAKKAKYYDYQTVVDAVNDYYTKNPEKKEKKSPSSIKLAQLKEQKMTEEIIRLKQEKERAALEIAELNRQVVKTKLVKEFLLFRYGVENAILRKLFLLDIPYKIVGVDTPKARTLCEEMYNEVQRAKNETLRLWDKEYNDDSDKATLDKIEMAVRQNNGDV